MEPETLKIEPTEMMGLVAKLQVTQQTLNYIDELVNFINPNQDE